MEMPGRWFDDPFTPFTHRRIAHKVEAICWRSDLTVHGMPSWLWAALDPNKIDSPVTRVDGLLHVKTPNGLAIAQEGVDRAQPTAAYGGYKPEEFARTFEPDQRPDRRNRVRGWSDEKEDEPRGSKRT
jgi:hypothetical protein